MGSPGRCGACDEGRVGHIWLSVNSSARLPRSSSSPLQPLWQVRSAIQGSHVCPSDGLEQEDAEKGSVLSVNSGGKWCCVLVA